MGKINKIGVDGEGAIGAEAAPSMRQGCAERSKTDWLAHTTAANQSPSKRSALVRAMKATWKRQREEVSP
jgi:hypothetical protein